MRTKPSAASSAAGLAPDARLLACAIDPATVDTIRQFVIARNWRQAEVIEGGLSTARLRLEAAAAPRLLIVDIDDAADPVESLTALSEISPPDMSVIAIGQYNDLSLYRSLMELGITEYLTKPVTVAAIERALLKDERHAPARSEQKEARIVTLIGARGGVGTTTIAAGVAWCLAEFDKQMVSALDLDLHFGNLALSLDLVPGSGLREALEYPTRIDSRLLGAGALAKSERLRIFAAEESLLEQPKVAPGAVETILNVLRTDCDFIVIDMPRMLDDVARRILSLANAIVVATDLSLSSARDTMRLVELARAVAPAAQRLVVGNQVGASHRGEVGRSDFERVVGLPLDHVIPFEGNVALATSSSGAALPAALRNSKASAALRAIAVQLSGKEAPAKRRVLLPSWLRRSA